MLYHESGNRAQVVLASTEARRHGIRSGMPLSEAQALLASAALVPHDPEADLLELQTLAYVSQQFTPVVGLELSCSSHCLVLDLTGCTHLFGDESSLARKLVIALSERGYFSHVGTANTVGAAWAIACYGHDTGSDRRLKSLPVASLRIPHKVVEQLSEFDLRTVGDLLGLPRESLPSRFGKELLERLDQMYGHCPELIIPVLQSEPVSAQWVTEDPINHPKAVRIVCADLLAEIVDVVKARGEGFLKLTLTLQSEAGVAVSIDVNLTRPTDSARHVMNLLELRLETHSIPEWLISIELAASLTAPLQIRQRGLFGNDESDLNAHISRLVDRLGSKLGSDAVVRPRLLPETVPEQAVDFVPASSRPPFNKEVPQQLVASARPLRLLPNPEPVRVTLAGAETTPRQFHWNRQSYSVAVSTEPERIETAWWQNTGTVRRDYYQVETHTGARFWLFRDSAGQWFIHGLFE